MKRFLAILILAATLMTMVSCGKENNDGQGTTDGNGGNQVQEPVAKEFKSNGLTITLTEDFVQKKQEGYTVCYDSASVAVLALRESFSLQTGMKDWTLQYYADLVKSSNASHTPTTPKKVGDRMVMEHTFFNPDTNITYHYYTCMYKGSDAFWLVQFACNAKEIDQHKADMVKWADSVRV